MGMGLISKVQQKIVAKIEEIQACPSCGCHADRWCNSCTRPDCHCSAQDDD
jgi:hypothetical protein